MGILSPDAADTAVSSYASIERTALRLPVRQQIALIRAIAASRDWADTPAADALIDACDQQDEAQREEAELLAGGRPYRGFGANAYQGAGL